MELKEEWVCQQPEISIVDMEADRVKNRKEAIQRVLNGTNYGALMKDFVESDEQELYLRVHEKVRADLRRFSQRTIAEAVHCKYTTSVWELDGVGTVWGYDKDKTSSWMSSSPLYQMRFIGRFLCCALCLFMLLFVGCGFSTLFFSVPYTTIGMAVTFAAIVFILALMCFAEHHNHFQKVDVAAIAAFPLVRYAEQEV